jgi:hypothetical protein
MLAYMFQQCEDMCVAMIRINVKIVSAHRMGLYFNPALFCAKNLPEKL